MGSLEDLFSRHEREFDTSEDNIVDWLSDGGKHGSRSSYRRTARALAEPYNIRREIDSATTLNQTQEIGRSIRSVQLNLSEVKADLRAKYDEKMEERARDLFSNVGASGSGMNKIIDVLKRNDYDLSSLRYHSYEVRGKTRVGVWEVGKSGFITNLKTEPRDIPEEIPRFDFEEDTE